MSLGRLFGFSGQVAVVEGERVSEAHVSYESITEGRWFGERHRGFVVVLDRFDVDRYGEAWGRYWGWDPKETWAFVTWVVYVGYLHARSTAGWRAGRAAIISCLGFASVLFTYYAVNLWTSGLHSYAGVK